jgi:hypothetical protein
MRDFGTLIEGAGLAAVGAFMVFAPDSANRLNDKIPYVGLGGRFGPAFGWFAMMAGCVLVVSWAAENLWLSHSN